MRVFGLHFFGAAAATILVIGCVDAASSQSAAAAKQPRDVCALLAAKEVAEVTGLPIERVAKTADGGCEWYANAAAQQQKGSDTARSTLQQLMTQEPKSADEGVRTMENLMKGLSGAAAPTKPVFAATVHWDDGDQAEAVLKGTMAVNSAGAPGGGLERIDGLGDRAFIGAMGTLFYVRKGRALVLFGASGITRDQEIALARKVVSKL